MSKDFHDLPVASCAVLALGEPTHREPAFGWVRNELFARLAEIGFRSIALETDRVAALRVDDFVKGGDGDLDEVAREGFSHDFGNLETNRCLVAWMRDHNASRPPEAAQLSRLRRPYGDDERPQPAALSRIRPGTDPAGSTSTSPDCWARTSSGAVRRR